jgi:hypothetical protein
MGCCEESVKDKLTILIPTSPIPSNPSTEIIDGTIARLRAYPDLADCKIVIMADGVRGEQEHRRPAYEEYKQALAHRGLHLEQCLMEFKEHSHQANMTAYALDFVTTPFVLFCEHDTFPVGDIPWRDFIRVMEAHPVDVKYIRLHLFDRMLPEHDYLMIDKEPRLVDGVPLMRTAQWSQRPHVAPTAYYRSILAEVFHRKPKTFIEDPLYGVIVEDHHAGAPPEKWGLNIYAPPGNMIRSGHSCGRTTGGDDPKYGLEHI